MGGQIDFVDPGQAHDRGGEGVAGLQVNGLTRDGDIHIHILAAAELRRVILGHVFFGKFLKLGDTGGLLAIAQTLKAGAVIGSHRQGGGIHRGVKSNLLAVDANRINGGTRCQHHWKSRDRGYLGY